MANRTILIIEEIPDHRDFLCRLLRAVGYRVVEATPATALDTARAERPDLILTALSLPGQPAWETARIIAQQPGLRSTPILAATVFNTLMPWPRIRAIGCADLLDKPFDLDELLRRIAALLPQAPQAMVAA